jgi:hypothetical protein
MGRINKRSPRIWRAGAELEGYWLRAPNEGERTQTGVKRSNGKLKGDSSVHANASLIPAKRREAIALYHASVEELNRVPYPFDLHGPTVPALNEVTGEFISNPLRARELPSWVYANYPDATDESCGLHVHVSFKHRLIYSRLMDIPRNPKLYQDAEPWTHKRMRENDFASYLLSSLYRWGKRAKVPEEDFWSRITGGNSRYCGTVDIDPIGQSLPEPSGSRYRALNYCYARHGTLEIRVLPAFRSRQRARAGVAFLLRAIERFARSVPTASGPVISADIDATECEEKASAYREVIPRIIHARYGAPSPCSGGDAELTYTRVDMFYDCYRDAWDIVRMLDIPAPYIPERESIACAFNNYLSECMRLEASHYGEIDDEGDWVHNCHRCAEAIMAKAKELTNHIRDRNGIPAL